jgi:hypothetical protein
MRAPNIFAHVDPDDRPNIACLEVTGGVTIEIGSVYLFFKDAAHAEQFVTDCDRGLTDMALALDLAARLEDA